MEVTWTQEALERLEDIQYHLAIREKSPTAARETLERIFAREPQIKEMPLSGRTVPDYNNPNLRELIEGSYRVIYLINGARILVVSVMHQRQLIPKVKEMKATAQAAIQSIQEEQG